MSITPPGSISASPPSKKSRWGRVGTVIRRSSTAFSIPGVRPGSPSPSERERDSDSASIKGSSKPPSVKQLETATLSPPAGNGNGMTPSPIAESPAREAAALAAEPVGPSPLASEDAVTTAPEPTLEPPAINEIPPTPATPAAAEQPALAAEPETAPAGEQQPAPEYTSKPPTEIGEQRAPPSIHEEDVSTEQAPVEQAPAEPAPPAADAPAPEAPPSIASEAAGAEQPAPVVPDQEHTAIHLDMPAPQPVVPPSGDYATQIWADQGQDPSRSVSAKQSIASLASSVAWSNANGNGNAGGKSTIQMPSNDPFGDPQSHDPGVSPADTIRVPEPLDPRSPREDAYQPVISMPLPAMQDVMPGQSARHMASGYSLSTKSTTGPVEPVGQATDERIPLLARTPPQQGQSKAFYVHQGTPSHRTPSIRSHVVADTLPRMQALGWNEHVLPDAAIYFVHPTLRVTTDIDLRNLRQLEIVTTYLDRDGDGFKVPQGCELWLRDAAEGKRRECVPVRNWVDHGKRIVSFESPWERDAQGSHHLHEDDKLDGQYRYWSFMEAHPAHAALSMAAHAEATDVLTWSYTDRLLPLSRPVPPPFTQEECQELMNLLRSFGAAPDASGIQTVVHTRIIARILLRIARWRQMHFRPHRPLPHDTHKTSHAHARHKTSFIRAVVDFFVGFICLGIPFLFIDRAHHRQMDEESGLHSAGPILVIGACSCLAAAIILSASVSFMSFPGLDNVARLAGFVAILCSAASMTASVIALFRYKADMERTVWHYDMSGAGMMLTRRSILMSLPLVFLAYSLAGLITSIVIYSFKGPSITPPGYPMYHDDYTKWAVIGTFGGLGGVLIMSALLSRR